jgi:hypothetical protein
MESMSWQLTGSVARLERAGLLVAIDIDQPLRGMHVESARGVTQPAIQPLRFTAVPAASDGRERVSEAYVRDTDLIIRYDELPYRDVRPTAVWHDLYPELGLEGIELRLFTQTEWLESHPEIHLTTGLPKSAALLSFERDTWQEVRVDGAGQSMATAIGAFLIRLPNSDLSYAEFVYPADFHGARLESENGTSSLHYQFFSEPLEKGVVRVGRVWSLWLTRHDDQQSASRLYRRFRESAPPLTA